VRVSSCGWGCEILLSMHHRESVEDTVLLLYINVLLCTTAVYSEVLDLPLCVCGGGADRGKLRAFDRFSFTNGSPAQIRIYWMEAGEIKLLIFQEVKCYSHHCRSSIV